MLNLLLRSTTKEHFREKNQLMSDVISTLIHKYYLLKLISRHQIKITRKKISIFIQVFLFLTFPSKHITYHSLLLLLWLSFLILSFSSSMTGSPLTSSAPGSNLIPPSLRSEPESWRKWKYSASVSVGSVSSWVNWIMRPILDCGNITVLSKSPWQGCQKAKLCQSNHRLLPEMTFTLLTFFLVLCHLKVDENVVGRHSHSWQSLSLLPVVTVPILCRGRVWKCLTAGCIKCLYHWSLECSDVCSGSGSAGSEGETDPGPGLGLGRLWCAPHSEKCQTWPDFDRIDTNYRKKNSVKFCLDCRGLIYQSCISTCHCCTACGSQCSVQCVFSHISCLCQSVLGVVSWSWGGLHSLHISQHPFLPRISFTGHYSDLGIIFFKRPSWWQETSRLPE